MISPDYLRKMARYNSWQNNQIWGFIEPMDQAALTADRGAFFGSILGTLNHIMWGDAMWLSRFGADVEKPLQTIDQTTDIHATGADWYANRTDMDTRISNWAQAMDSEALAQPVEWHSGATGQDYSHAMSLCVIHLFNHQTHHRGQVHAMLTAAGSKAPVTDLVFMPEP